MNQQFNITARPSPMSDSERQRRLSQAYDRLFATGKRLGLVGASGVGAAVKPKAKVTDGQE